jgi:toxin ParE1/3/4
VGKLIFSRRAGADLLNIGQYTLQTWGALQANLYLSEIEQCCLKLAANPLLGRTCDRVRPGLRRMEQGKHIVLYRQRGKDIVVSRILHRCMLPDRHLIEEEERG